MGRDITVVIVDWTRLEPMSAGERLGALQDAAWPDVDDSELLATLGEWVEGWEWPSPPETVWYARYSFPAGFGAGSDKPHSWAGYAWRDVRDFADPGLRAALDGFLGGLGLAWNSPDDEAVHIDPELPEDMRSGFLLAHAPESVSALAAQWAEAASLLDGLRGPFDVHAADPDGWFREFESFAVLLRCWGDVVAEANRRGWALIGLP